MAPKRQASLKAASSFSTKKNPARSPSRGKAAKPADAEHERLEDLMRQFDLNPEYGPCVGITRLERWERAQRLGKMPPAEVKAYLTDPAIIRQIPTINYNLWHGIL